MKRPCVTTKCKCYDLANLLVYIYIYIYTYVCIYIYIYKAIEALPAIDHSLVKYNAVKTEFYAPHAEAHTMIRYSMS